MGSHIENLTDNELVVFGKVCQHELLFWHDIAIAKLSLDRLLSGLNFLTSLPFRSSSSPYYCFIDRYFRLQDSVWRSTSYVRFYSYGPLHFFLPRSFKHGQFHSIGTSINQDTQSTKCLCTLHLHAVSLLLTLLLLHCHGLSFGACTWKPLENYPC